MKFLSIPLALAVAVGCALSTTARAADGVDAEALYRKAVKSCVYIITPSKGEIAQGSGSLIDVEKKLVVTNYHVVDGRDIVFVQFPIFKANGELETDKEVYKANVPANKAIKGKVLHRDKTRNLAFIELEKVPPGTPALPLAKSSVGVGAPVWNIGNPVAVEQVFSVTEGKVRGVGLEKLDFGDQVVIAKMVTTTNAVNSGDSGGPLIDKRGFQVAVAQSINLKAQLVSSFVDISEVHAYLSEKKLKIKELSPETDPKAGPKPGTIPKQAEEPKKDIPEPKKEAGLATTSVQEQEATELLRRSKLFSMGDDNRKIYLAKLQEIIKNFPGTEAARDAKQILDGLK